MSKFTSTTLLVAASIAVPALQPREADACGGGFWSTSVTIDSSLDAQRTLLVYDGTGSVRHYVQVSYTGDPKEFAWVYPLPSNPDAPVAVDDGEALFTTLDDLTKPSFHIQVNHGSSGGGGGCLCIGMGAAGDSQPWGADGGVDGGGVTIWGGGRVGIFDYVVITAATIDPMMTWLDDNLFRVPPEASPVLEHYVTGGFYFVAMKIDLEAAGVTGEGSTTTILFRYAAPERVYPLHMASIGAAPDTSVLLYVLAAHRVEAGAPYANVLIDSSDLTVGGSEPDFTVDYESQFASHIAGAGGRAFVTEFAGMRSEAGSWSTTLRDLPAGFFPMLTRLRTTLGPDRMTDDVVLVDAPADAPVSRDFNFTVTVAANESSGSPDILLALAVPAAILFFVRLRRRSS